MPPLLRRLVARHGVLYASAARMFYLAWRQCFKASDQGKLQPPRHPQSVIGSLHIHGLSAPLPCDLYLWPQRRSYTGQMVAELHTLGSPPLLDALLKSLCAAGARMAGPGEFTLRAFLSGRIDLTQAEAVLGVIDAADQQEFKVAVDQLAGGLAGPLHDLRDMILELLAHLEAGFDFADEDLPFITAQDMQIRLAEAVENVARLAAQMESRGAVQTDIKAVLVGQPNTGKSSLFNALTRKTHALVSDLPGTTRDYLVAELDFEGLKCQLIDTAGLKADSGHPAAASELPERAAQQAATEQIRRAQVRLLCLDATRPLDAWEQTQLARRDDLHRIVVWTKMDAVLSGVGSDAQAASADLRRPLARTVMTSSITGEGLDQLRDELLSAVLDAQAADCEVVAGTAVRCHQSLYHAGQSLRNALDIARHYKGTVPFSPTVLIARCPENWDSPQIGGEEFIAAEIRVALEELGKVVGAVYADDVLERIFSRFCVGK